MDDDWIDKAESGSENDSTLEQSFIDDELVGPHEDSYSRHLIQQCSDGNQEMKTLVNSCTSFENSNSDSNSTYLRDSFVASDSSAISLLGEETSDFSDSSHEATSGEKPRKRILRRPTDS